MPEGYLKTSAGSNKREGKVAGEVRLSRDEVTSAENSSSSSSKSE